MNEIRVDLATISDIEVLWRQLTPEETVRADALLSIVSDTLREEAFKVGKDIDEMIAERPSYENVVKQVVVDVIARTLMTSTNKEPMTQFSESALGYSVSGTFLTPGGGLFIKRGELKRLGLARSRLGALDIYGINKRDSSNSV